jgi:hypothetical protein
MSYSFNGETFNSLTDYIQALKESDNRYNSYEPWSLEEDQELKELLKLKNIEELANHFKRRKGGIESRIRKLYGHDISKNITVSNPLIFQKNIFEQIIEDLKFSFKISNDNDLIKFVKKLQKHLKKFHESINESGIVRMNYADKDIQIIYVLRYFHAYWFQIFNSLNIISDELFSYILPKKELKIALFAAGPAPEVIGITRFLENNFDKYTSVNVDLYDEEKEWEFARKTFLFSNNKQNYLENNLNMKIRSYSIRLDNHNDLKNFKVRGYYDVVSFQNCLNEFWDNNSTGDKNFFGILNCLKPSGFAIFTDRDTKNTVRPLNEIKQQAYQHQYKILHDINYEKFDALEDSPLPEILNNGNFYSKPYSKSGFSAMRTNKFKSLIIQNKESKKLSDTLGHIERTFEEESKTHIINNDSNKVNLLGMKIIHKDFGQGIISDIDKHLILIEFDDYGMVALKLPVTRMRFR